MATDRSVEVDVHVWCKPETATTVALYTISIGSRGLCIDLPRSMALDVLDEYLEELADGD